MTDIIRSPLVFDEPLNYSQPYITDDDIAAVVNVLDSGWIAGNGRVSKDFADRLRWFTGYNYAILVNSATTGLMLAYDYLVESGLYNRGDKISMPDLTFIATANAAIQAGLVPDPIDVTRETLISKVSNVGVSFAGYPTSGHIICDDAHGFYYKMAERRTNFISIVSTHALKQLNTGEGGIVLTDSKDVADYMTQFIDQGRTAEKRFGYGFNFRMSEINAALGLSQLRRACSMQDWRKILAKIYYDRLGKDERLVMPADHENHAWHLFVIRLSEIGHWGTITTSGKRDRIGRAFRKYNVFVGVHYPPLSSYHHIEHRGRYPNINSYDAFYTGLSLPLHNGMSKDDVHQVCDILEILLDEIQ
jgi:dTDP-4-amino-4,6-dideoxygalactose transaminase